MNILNIAYPFSPVNPAAAGSSEQVIRLIDQHLVNEGYKSVVISHQDSVVKGRNYFLPERDGDINSIKDEVYAGYRKLIKSVIHREGIDLIHMHGLDFYEYIPDVNIPVLVTVHFPTTHYPEEAFRMRRNVFFNCVSYTQQNQMTMRTRLVPFIPNGIRVEEFLFSEIKKDYCLCLGRIWYDKGYHLALQAARSAGVPLYIAGDTGNFESHKIYFNEFIAPNIDGKKYRSISPLSFDQKVKLLSGAMCLLVPSIAEDATSLEAMEALASGTPVIAHNTGALPEIVEDYRTGFIVKDHSEMASSIKLLNRISPQVCRSEALRRFSARNMTDKYLELYNSLVRRKNTVHSPSC